MKARLTILIAVITLLASCKKNSDTDNATPTIEFKISEAEKTKITNYISSKRSKTDKLGNSSIDTVLKSINWEKFKICYNKLGERLTAIELNITGNTMLLLLYSPKAEDRFTDVQLVVIKQQNFVDVNLLEISSSIYTNEKISFTGTIAYYKVTRQLLFEAGYETGERKFIKKFNQSTTPVNSINSRTVCYDYYLVTYWSDGTIDKQFLFTHCTDSKSEECKQTRSLAYSSGTAFSVSRCDGGGENDENIVVLPTRQKDWVVAAAASGSWMVSSTEQFSGIESTVGGKQFTGITHLGDNGYALSNDVNVVWVRQGVTTTLTNIWVATCQISGKLTVNISNNATGYVDPSDLMEDRLTSNSKNWAVTEIW